MDLIPQGGDWIGDFASGIAGTIGKEIKDAIENKVQQTITELNQQRTNLESMLERFNSHLCFLKNINENNFIKINKTLDEIISVIETNSKTTNTELWKEKIKAEKIALSSWQENVERLITTIEMKRNKIKSLIAEIENKIREIIN